MDEPDDVRREDIVIEWDEGRATAAAGQSVRIGRDDSMDVTVDDPLVSREHAQIVWEDGWFLVDAGSKNGTFVEGRPVARYPVRDRVTVRCGHARNGPMLSRSIGP
ncbi:FHA domain-containing protein, partial [Rhodococcus chondri]